MKQVIQSFESGELVVADVPPPVLRPGGILVRTGASLVSAGTERMVVDFAEKNLIQKAQARPDLVKQVIDKAQRDGLINTFDAVRNRLSQPLALGYSIAGEVVEVGSEATDYRVGDRVACAGGGFASHAEMTYIPRNLAVKMPEQVSYEAGAFTTLGAIALQGVRQSEVVLGSRVAVIGLGLLGQLTVMLLKAAGCTVIGIDLNPARVELAKQMGADAACVNDLARQQASAFSHQHGCDAVLITADTRSSDPVVLAGDICRDRGIVVAVGAVGLEIPRKVYYEKELDFRLSRSYGPGRYDPDYEERGHDYPYGYVRWTEQRNMEAFVQLLADGKIDVAPLITHRFPIDNAVQAYDVITGKTGEPFLGVLLSYDQKRDLPRRIPLHPAAASHTAEDTIRVGMVGAGNFVQATLLPAMQQIPGLHLTGIVSGSGLNAQTSGQRYGFAYCAAEVDELLKDAQINWLAIATRHNLHAQQAIAAMQAGKDVFVEKPLALNIDELTNIIRTQQQTGRRLVVGFNRRFAPLVQAMVDFLKGHSKPLIATYRVNAGAIPATHWTQSAEEGGGRIIGEACHFIDLLQYLTGAQPTRVYATAARTEQGLIDDEVIITINFSDGSVGTVMYAAGGDSAFGKERIEVIGDSKVATLDNFQTLELVHNGKRNQTRQRLRTSKGHHEQWEALVAAVQTGKESPIPLDEIIATHLATFAAVESIHSGQPVAIDLATFCAQLET